MDTGARDLAGFPGEKITEGLDGLRERLAEYRELGARFAKWRGVITIGKGLPTDYCVDANAHALARYAALCQEGGVVPIVEPEVLMDGDHDIHLCERVTSYVLRKTFEQLAEHRVLLEGVILKPNMVLPGTKSTTPATVAEIAEITLRCFLNTVPSAVPGICFLSGGQSPEEATINLNAMNAMGRYPWELSFSYGRALQEPVLKAWGGKRRECGRRTRRSCGTSPIQWACPRRHVLRRNGACCVARRLPPPPTRGKGDPALPHPADSPDADLPVVRHV